MVAAGALNPSDHSVLYLSVPSAAAVDVEVAE
jgi:hypothetical protein